VVDRRRRGTMWRTGPGTCALTSLASVMERGVLDLPCGERLVAGAGFRCIALGHRMGGEGEGGWVAPEVAGMFHFVHVDPLPRDELTEVLVGLYLELEGSEPLEQIVGL